MLEEGAQGIESTDREDAGLSDQITHWVTVLNRWVSDLDRGMGRDGGERRPQAAVDDIGADP